MVVFSRGRFAGGIFIDSERMTTVSAHEIDGKSGSHRAFGGGAPVSPDRPDLSPYWQLASGALLPVCPEFGPPALVAVPLQPWELPLEEGTPLSPSAVLPVDPGSTVVVVVPFLTVVSLWPGALGAGVPPCVVEPAVPDCCAMADVAMPRAKRDTARILVMDVSCF
jgi:hypothetical protein